MARLSKIPTLNAALTPALLAALLSLGASGCTGRAALTTGGSDAADASDAADTSTDAGTSSGESGSSDTADAADTADTADTADDSNEDGAGFLDIDDTMPEPEQCDFFAQDCPEGQKCTMASSQGEGRGFDMHICVDVGTEPPLTPCTIVEGADPYNATDTCDATGKCFDLDPDTGIGTCFEMCVGTYESPDCPITGFECSVLNNGYFYFCFPGCSPLDAGSCPAGDVCVAAYEGDTLGGFICFPPAAEGITGESCECANCCANGHLCNTAEFYGPGCEYELCCTEYCDITDAAFTCAGPDQQCVALFEPTDPVWSNVGACMVP